MDVQQKLDEIAASVEGAKAMPMSASCVINRKDLLARIEELREALPGSLAQAREVLGDREQVVAEAQQEARRIVEAAHHERGSLVGGTEIVQQARAEASRILEEARRDAAESKAEADDYVDSKLANFEVVLGKTIGSVDRGRDKLLGPDRAGGDPQELLDRADAYVDAQFSAIEAVLRKTLEAVGRGRLKLTGHRPSDELMDHLPSQGGPQEAEDDGGYFGRAPGGAPDRESPASHDYRDSQGGYRQEPYGNGGYEPRPYAPAQEDRHPSAPAGQDAYAQAGPGYGYAQQSPEYQQAQYQQSQDYQQSQYQQLAGHRSGGALEETSFFDTQMIDAEQLRRYEQGR
ncbi:ATP synthase F0 subunit B [Streptomyces sp. ACA25]|uniref:ATP synthase F0 subunit B n=1 Tax=Streptomyces sp. ACA25 TaxID=3022596 RepID=UPI0023071A1B|nr:ATP synthase F0 subunit B [Streptomyces sp. ACA25]MDB1089623.1 ATP synthase F0 subunit B [Streptomyces sp. ACA25]